MTLRRPVIQSGFTLIEVLISVFLLAVTALGVAQLIAMSVRSIRGAKEQTSTAVLATQKIEQLRGLTWSLVRPAGGGPAVPVSDLTTDLSAETATDGGPGLRASPGGALDQSTDGYVDYLNEAGVWMGTGPDPPPGTVYVRRWSVTPISTTPEAALVVQVVVTSLRRESQRAGAGSLLDETRLVTVRMRKLQ